MDAVSRALDGRLAGILCKAFNVESLPENPSPSNLTAWDSLGHLALMNELERVFGVRFTVEEWSQMVSARAIAEILAERGIA